MADFPALGHQGQLALADLSFHSDAVVDLADRGLRDLNLNTDEAELELTRAVASELAERVSRGSVLDTEGAFSQILGASLDSIAGRSDVLNIALGHYGAALAIETGLNNLSQDLVSGVETIATTAARGAAPGVDDPALVYLIAAGRRVHQQLLDRALEEADLACHRLAGLPLLASLASELQTRLRAVRDKLGAESPPPAHPIPDETLHQTLSRRARLAANRARGFLLGDPHLLEAREVQRREGLDGGEMMSLFPVSFPLEALARNGEAVQDRLATWVTDLAARSFAYYDHRLFKALDSDTVGAVLRLSKYQPDEDVVKDLVARLERAIGNGDRIPVWLERPADPRLRLTGERCAAVEANLLLGLATGTPARFEAIGAKSFARLCSDFVSRGCATTADYVTEYLLVPLARLMTVTGADQPEVLARMSLEIDKRATTASAQTAAFLAIAATTLPSLGFDPAPWTDVIVRAQRHDGGFDAEPLFWVNGPGGRPEWFKSRTVTTAFCFDALLS